MNDLNVLIQAVINKAEKPISGYEIHKIVESMTNHTHQQVYRELKKISSKKGFIVEDVPQEGKPDKKVYSFKGDGFLAKKPGLFRSDFSKTQLAYSLAVSDVLNGTCLFNEYQKKMKDVEIEFLKEIENAKSNN